MKIYNLKQCVPDYLMYLTKEERSIATKKQYCREVIRFISWAADLEAVKETVIHYKEKLKQEYKTVSSINTKLAALNGFFTFIGRTDLKVKQMKAQRQIYCSEEKELTKEEYFRLITAAEAKGEKSVLILQTICSTGIRVSELQFITAEAVKAGEASVRLKGKDRVILIPDQMCRLLQNYLKQKRISSGPVFITRTGKPIDRSNIWKMMKSLCEAAHVDQEKVFPHNLRHLFARCFYHADKDIAKLADVLGHSSINTTRLYIISTFAEHRMLVDSLGLLCESKKISADTLCIHTLKTT